MPRFALAAAVLLAGLVSYWFNVGELAPASRGDGSFREIPAGC